LSATTPPHHGAAARDRRDTNEREQNQQVQQQRQDRGDGVGHDTHVIILLFCSERGSSAPGANPLHDTAAVGD
jgi:hypothetical protein